MAETLVFLLAALLIVGVLTQWFAWRLHLPPILLLVVGGLIAGPIAGWLHPDQVLGDLLQPVVSLGVAIILFEGGMTLRWSELKGVGRALFLLVSLGAVITWAVGAAAAHLLADVPLPVAMLLGALLTVSGPTVVGPMLNHIRPRGAVATLLKWEGIVIDPVGAGLAILTFIAIEARGAEEAFTAVAAGVVTGTVVGVVAGLVAAILLTIGLARYWIPDHLQNAVALGFVLAAFLVANAAQAEAGLISVTVMGIFMANQKYASVRPILEFKETLRVLIIPTLFILLTARITRADIDFIAPVHFVFLAILILVARPLAAFLCTLGSRLDWRERVFLGGIMPRGIVAAAVASVLAFDLAEMDVPGSEALVPLTFLVILGTVVVYSIGGPLLARGLGVSRQGTGDVLFIGAGPFARAFARVLQAADVAVRLVDTNRPNVVEANVQDLRATQTDALSESAAQRLDLERVDHVLALTPNNQTNQLCAVRYAEHVGRAEVYRLAARRKTQEREQWTVGRMLFSEESDWATLDKRLRGGDRIVRTQLTEQFDYEDWKKHHGETALPLALVHDDQTVTFVATDVRPEPGTGDIVVGLVPAEEQTGRSS